MTMLKDASEFKSSIENAFTKLSSPLSHQKEAWSALESLGLPTRKSEAYQYVPLAKVYHSALREATDASTIEIPKILDRGPSLTFIDGKLSAEHSNLSAFPSEVLVLPMQQAVEKFGAYLEGKWKSDLRLEKDPFTLINQSLSSNALFVYIPQNVSCEETIKLRSYITQAEGSCYPSLYIFMGAHAKASFTEEFIRTKDSHALCSGLLDIHLEKNAELSFYNNTKSLSEAWSLFATRATLQGSSKLNIVDCNTSGCVRRDYKVYLNEPNCFASLSGLWTHHSKNQSHAHVLMEHRAPDCISSQLFKGILGHHSRSSFEGKIYIHSEAQKTEAYQSNHNLLLSDSAFAASKPNLEIFADDVKASHGSTTGEIDEEQLFYLRTRGLSESIAKRFLVKAFSQDVLEKVENADFRQIINRDILNALEHALSG